MTSFHIDIVRYLRPNYKESSLQLFVDNYLRATDFFFQITINAKYEIYCFLI